MSANLNKEMDVELARAARRVPVRARSRAASVSRPARRRCNGS